jgi:hypothetical protein
MVSSFLKIDEFIVAQSELIKKEMGNISLTMIAYDDIL